MTKMPGTIWRPVDAFTPGHVTRPPRGMVVHTAVTPATLGALDGLIAGFNQARQVSAYFAVGIDGAIAQCVDLDDKAWTQAAGNGEWVGVENVGDGTKEPLTDAQVSANARILAWLHALYGVPLVRTDDPVNGRGLGWHGMGGAAWGGHPICPGEFIKAQLGEIVARASGAPVPSPQRKDTHMARMVAHSAGARALVTLNDKGDGTGDQLVAQGCAPFVASTDGKVSPSVFHLSSPATEIVATADGHGILVRFADGHFDVAPIDTASGHVA